MSIIACDVWREGKDPDAAGLTGAVGKYSMVQVAKQPIRIPRAVLATVALEDSDLPNARFRLLNMGFEGEVVIGVA